LQFNKGDEDGRRYVCGGVVVAKNPCIHPSEIRKLRGVDATKKLGHLENVIVFSTKPGPDCKVPSFQLMGNGDLDGDKYWVCWDNELFDSVNEIPCTKIP